MDWIQTFEDSRRGWTIALAALAVALAGIILVRAELYDGEAGQQHGVAPLAAQLAADAE